MKLEDQVVSLELAKKLKEIGIKQESLWYWHQKDIEQVEADEYGEDYTIVGFLEKGETPYDRWSAYTVSELGEMLLVYGLPLPTYQYTDKAFYYKLLKNVEQKTKAWGESKRVGIEEINYGASTEANARAKMLIELKNAP